MFQYKINVNELIAMLFVKDSVAKKGQTGEPLENNVDNVDSPVFFSPFPK